MLALTLTEAYQFTHQEGKVKLRLKIVWTWQVGLMGSAGPI